MVVNSVTIQHPEEPTIYRERRLSFLQKFTLILRGLTGRSFSIVQLSLAMNSNFKSISGSVPNNQVNSGHDCWHTDLLLQNYSNFKRSGIPARLMHHVDGSWVDFSGEEMDLLRKGFVEGQPVVEVKIAGARCLIDFYRMLQVRLDDGNQRSVAWIDVNGKCFFPKTFTDGGEACENFEIPKIEIEVRIGEDLNFGKRKRGGEEEFIEVTCSNDQPREAKMAKVTTHAVESPRWPKAKLLEEDERAFSIVKNLFLSGIEVVDRGATVTSIHQFMRRGPLDKARYEVFQKQMEITKVARGEAKMTFAWHGTSAKNVASILSHGFSMPSKTSGFQAHGVGIYLSPVRSAYRSAMLSEVDDNGEKHVILCRVILGKCEKVEAGSQQMYPSSVDFDTGVDDLKNPMWYVVWGANMNTHILPECVVSYRSSDHVPGQLRGSSFLKSIPESSALFAKLFSKLGNTHPSSRVQELQTLCSAYKDGKMAKDCFMKQLRSVVGDEMLVTTIREVCG